MKKIVYTLLPIFAEMIMTMSALFRFHRTFLALLRRPFNRSLSFIVIRFKYTSIPKGVLRGSKNSLCKGISSRL